MTPTQKRIQARWKNNILSGGELGTPSSGISTYSGSSVTNTTGDFLGDWRAADSWMRFDMYRVRNRSRQLERGNPWCKAFARALRNNVCGHKGFFFKPDVIHAAAFGDSSEGGSDDAANAMIMAAMEVQGRSVNFTTRKRLSRRDVDRLLVTRLAFDGEVILRKRKGFANDCAFAWQIIDPDYLDYNLNRVEPNGNITKMGVEFEETDKFPVAYWLLHRRPNDYFYNYTDLNQQRYIRVDASEILHLFVQTDDTEQTRGWPWIFAAVVNLFRMNKFEEAALVNATIGASKGIFYTTEYPEGYEGEIQESDGSRVDEIEPGMAVSLPPGVKPVQVDMRYPDGEIEPFRAAMALSFSAAFGTSYATTTGDLSKANFVSSRVGQLEEREFYMEVQEFLIEKWKKPGYDEELYRAMLSRNVPLPLAKFPKFNRPHFRGRRWPFVQPVDDAKAKQILLDNRIISLSSVIEELGGDPEATFLQIAKDEKRLKELDIERITGLPQLEEPDPASQGDGSIPAEPKTPKPQKE